MISGKACKVGEIVETEASVAGELITSAAAVPVVEAAPAPVEAAEETPAPAPRKGKK